METLCNHFSLALLSFFTLSLKRLETVKQNGRYDDEMSHLFFADFHEIKNESDNLFLSPYDRISKPNNYFQSNLLLLANTSSWRAHHRLMRNELPFSRLITSLNSCDNFFFFFLGQSFGGTNGAFEYWTIRRYERCHYVRRTQFMIIQTLSFSFSQIAGFYILFYLLCLF